MITGEYTKDDVTWFKAKEMSFPWNNKAVLWVDDKPKNNKFSSYIGINGTAGKNLDINNPINNRKESLKIGLQYKINQYSNIKYNFEYLMFTDNISPNNNYSEMRAKLSLKISF